MEGLFLKVVLRISVPKLFVFGTKANEEDNGMDIYPN